MQTNGNQNVQGMDFVAADHLEKLKNNCKKQGDVECPKCNRIIFFRKLKKTTTCKWCGEIFTPHKFGKNHI